MGNISARRLGGYSGGSEGWKMTPERIQLAVFVAMLIALAALVLWLTPDVWNGSPISSN